MDILRSIWNVIQYQVLGMRWLQDWMAKLVAALGFDPASRLGGSVTFFLYDGIKILLLLCLLIFGISYIQSYFPPERSKRILGKFHGLGANCIAALLGTVTPFCSCSSIPLFMGFTSAGLPLGVTFSFLISSPMVDLGSLVLLMSIFGPKVAVAYVLFGLAVAVLGGSLIQRLGLEDQVADFIRQARQAEGNPLPLQPKTGSATQRIRCWLPYKRYIPMCWLAWPIGAVIHNWIPEDFVVRLLGAHNPFGVLLATLAGTPMYADIFGTIPIAEALLAKGAQLGVVLSFMMAVTTLSLPSMILLKKAVKPKLLAIFVAICLVGIICTGYVFNGLQPFLL